MNNELKNEMLKKCIEEKMKERDYKNIVKNLDNNDIIASLWRYFKNNNIELDGIGEILFNEIIKRLCL